MIRVNSASDLYSGSTTVKVVVFLRLNRYTRAYFLAYLMTRAHNRTETGVAAGRLFDCLARCSSAPAAGQPSRKSVTTPPWTSALKPSRVERQYKKHARCQTVEFRGDWLVASWWYWVSYR